MDDPHHTDLVLRILAGDDELNPEPELEQLKKDPATKRQLDHWRRILRIAASILDDSATWEDLPDEQQKRILATSSRIFREMTATSDEETEEIGVPALSKISCSSRPKAATPFGWRSARR